MNIENRYSNGMEYCWNFWNGMEWNTENLEYYSSFWSIFRNTIRILEKVNFQEYQKKWHSISIPEYPSTARQKKNIVPRLSRV